MNRPLTAEQRMDVQALAPFAQGILLEWPATKPHPPDIVDVACRADMWRWNSHGAHVSDVARRYVYRILWRVSRDLGLDESWYER